MVAPRPMGGGFAMSDQTTDKPNNKKGGLNMSPIIEAANERLIYPRVEDMILDPKRFGDYVPGRTIHGVPSHELYDSLCTTGGTVYAEGPTGCGKTYDLEAWAAIGGHAGAKISCNGAVDPADWLGRLILLSDGSSATVVSRLRALIEHAQQHPERKYFIIFDEYPFLPPDIAAMVHPMTDHSRQLPLGDGTVVPIPANVLIMATGNPRTYAGSKTGNLAAADRWDVVVKVDYDVRLERELVPFDELHDAVAALRNNKAVVTPVTTRQLVRFDAQCKTYGVDFALASWKSRLLESEIVQFTNVWDMTVVDAARSYYGETVSDDVFADITL